MRSDGPAGYHLGLTVVAPLVHYFFGDSLGLHLALAAGLGALMSAAFYVVTRLVGLERLPAAAIAALVLLFPFSDSTRLWAMASFNQIAVIFWLLGVFVAFAGLRQTDRGRAVGLHAAALVLYATGIVIYEQVGGAVLASIVLYVLRGTRWREASIRWVGDAVVTGVTLYIAATQALPRGILSWGDRVDHARLIAEDALSLLPYVFVPFATPNRLVVAGVAIVVLTFAFLRQRRLPRGDGERSALRRWLSITALGVGGIGTGYLLTVPSTYGSPLDFGIENRVNMLAAFGWVTLLYAVGMLAGLFALARAGRSTAWAPLVPLVLCVVVAAGYVERLADSSAAYDRSHAEQVKVLRAVGSQGPYAPGSTIYTFGHPTYIAQGIPVFTWIWDQNPAVKVWLRDPSVASFPMLPGTTFDCGPTSMHPVTPYMYGEGQTSAYGMGYFVDTERGVSTRIDDRAQCRREAARYQPGSLLRGRGDCGLAGGGPATRLRFVCDGRFVEVL